MTFLISDSAIYSHITVPFLLWTSDWINYLFAATGRYRRALQGGVPGVLEAHSPQEFINSTLFQTTVLVWHDTIQAIKAVPSKNTAQVRVKMAALREWKDYGGAIGVIAGVTLATTKEVSTPSSEERYWKIDKRCFARDCACAGPEQCGLAMHSLRVCKGCYRVLYCGSNCQKRYALFSLLGVIVFK